MTLLDIVALLRANLKNRRSTVYGSTTYTWFPYLYRPAIGDKDWIEWIPYIPEPKNKSNV